MNLRVLAIPASFAFCAIVLFGILNYLGTRDGNTPTLAADDTTQLASLNVTETDPQPGDDNQTSPHDTAPTQDPDTPAVDAEDSASTGSIDQPETPVVTDAPSTDSPDQPETPAVIVESSDSTNDTDQPETPAGTIEDSERGDGADQPGTSIDAADEDGSDEAGSDEGGSSHGAEPSETQSQAPQGEDVDGQQSPATADDSPAQADANDTTTQTNGEVDDTSNTDEPVTDTADTPEITPTGQPSDAPIDTPVDVADDTPGDTGNSGDGGQTIQENGDASTDTQDTPNPNTGVETVLSADPTPEDQPITEQPLTLVELNREEQASFGRTSVDGDGTLSILQGQGVAGSVLEILADDKVVLTTNINPSGNWSFYQNAALPSGLNHVTLRSRLADGRVGISDQSLIAFLPDDGGAVKGALLDQGQVTVLNAPRFVTQLAIEGLIYSPDGLVLFGKAPAGAEVAFVGGNNPSALIGSDGIWSLNLGTTAEGTLVQRSPITGQDVETLPLSLPVAPDLTDGQTLGLAGGIALGLNGQTLLLF